MDKDNVTMSSYKIDTKTNLPILYLQDNKQELWKKFEATYPDGIKCTSFMAHLASGTICISKRSGWSMQYL